MSQDDWRWFIFILVITLVSIPAVVVTVITSETLYTIYTRFSVWLDRWLDRFSAQNDNRNTQQ